MHRPLVILRYAYTPLYTLGHWFSKFFRSRRTIVRYGESRGEMHLSQKRRDVEYHTLISYCSFLSLLPRPRPPYVAYVARREYYLR